MLSSECEDRESAIIKHNRGLSSILLERTNANADEADDTTQLYLSLQLNHTCTHLPHRGEAGPRGRPKHPHHHNPAGLAPPAIPACAQHAAEGAACDEAERYAAGQS
ncbi:hypothetical protein SKAU_G00252220 [Synaphobranchus kaupii]|uniref:Uncharacterized protein n=1 Tax=Synaphobranchus kaupii TaxID=118154 RepID=A0A9Q1IS08_SYNKA|nr:hypothetical protein SKAU_G00252220 [Synaphobranchus kaupii]